MIGIIGYGYEYPTMHYFGNTRHTQSMIALIYDFDCLCMEIPEKNCIVGMLLTCPIERTAHEYIDEGINKNSV